LVCECSLWTAGKFWREYDCDDRPARHAHGKDGKAQERIYDVGVSGGRKIGPDGRCKTLVGSTVDVANATYTNAIGAMTLSVYWKDPAFDASERAFYYIRVIQIPSPRWTAYDQKRFGIKMADYVPMTVRSLLLNMLVRR